MTSSPIATKTLAIPLAIHPYSSTSRVVHWLTPRHGKISTLLKGALRPRSPFLGEYELFSTSELLYLPRRGGTLHLARECALLHPRPAFRNDWRAMRAASYLATLFDRTVPDESPHPGLFEFFEELLDLAEGHGRHPSFLPWAELQFCDHQGHAPHLENCAQCGATETLAFHAPSGGLVCAECARRHKLPTLGTDPATLAALRRWQRLPHPATPPDVPAAQRRRIAGLLGAFMAYHFAIPPESRRAAGIGD